MPEAAQRGELAQELVVGARTREVGGKPARTRPSWSQTPHDLDRPAKVLLAHSLPQPARTRRIGIRRQGSPIQGRTWGILVIEIDIALLRPQRREYLRLPPRPVRNPAEPDGEQGDEEHDEA